MAAWRYQEDWERKKKYLIRSMFAEPPVLSPIQERPESTLESPSPVTDRDSPLYSRRTDRESPLPELIIEPEKKRRHDYSNRFYDKLEKKMKKYYRILFYGEQLDIGSSISEDNASDGINESPRIPRFCEENNETEIESGEDNNKDDASNGEHIIEGGDKTSEAELETSITRSEVANDTPDSPSPSLTSDKQRDLQGRHGESPADESKSLCTTERLSAMSSNSSGKVETVLVKAMVHSSKDSDQEEPEQMRRHKCVDILEDVSYHRREDYVETQRPTPNVAHLSMEKLSESSSTLNHSLPMDLLSESFQPLLINPTPACTQKSPTLGRKRLSVDHPIKETVTSTTAGSPIMSWNLPSHISTKRKRYNPVLTNSVMTQTDPTEQKNEGKESRRQSDHFHDRKAAEVQTELSTCDAGNQCNIDTHNTEWIACRNAAVQTENISTDQSTQTDQIIFEDLRIFIASTINYFE